MLKGDKIIKNGYKGATRVRGNPNLLKRREDLSTQKKCRREGFKVKITYRTDILYTHTNQ